MARSVVRLDCDRDGERGPNRTTTGLSVPSFEDDMVNKKVSRSVKCMTVMSMKCCSSGTCWVNI